MPDATPNSNLTPEQVEQAREALRNPGEATPVMQPQASAPAPMAAASMTPPAKVNPNAPIVAAPVAPAMTPPANAAAPQMPSAADSQEGRLAELLLLYKNDQISPSEYQARRAKILSGQ
jgi:hypothetical protein